MRPTLPRMRWANMPTFGAKLTPWISPHHVEKKHGQIWGAGNTAETRIVRLKEWYVLATWHVWKIGSSGCEIEITTAIPSVLKDFDAVILMISFSSSVFLTAFSHGYRIFLLQTYPAKLRSLESTPLATHPRHTPDVAGPPGPENWGRKWMEHWFWERYGMFAWSFGKLLFWEMTFSGTVGWLILRVIVMGI